MIKQINNDIAALQNKISVLEERKTIIEKMAKLIETLGDDEKQALYELLQEQALEGEFGWSK